jgi:hypothetical protein
LRRASFVLETPLEAEFGFPGGKLEDGKLEDGKLAGGELAGGKLLVAGNTPIGPVPGGGTLVEFIEAPRLADGVFASAVAGAASDVKSGREDDGNPLFKAGMDGAAGSEGNVAEEDGKAGEDAVSSDGKAAGGSVAAVALLEGRGNVPLGTGKGDPRVAVGRARELSLLSKSRSFAAVAGVFGPTAGFRPTVGFAEPAGVDCAGANTDGAARPTRFEVSRFGLLEGSTGGATRVSAVLIGFILGFALGLTPAFTIGFGWEVLVGGSSSLLRPCTLGVDSFSGERRLIIRDASNRGGSDAFDGLSNVNGTAGPL